ncbi:MAG: hypothetical protein ABEJ74_03505 [Haloferacaceae archaeon]
MVPVQTTPRSTDGTKTTRRRLLGVAGAAALGSVAGCTAPPSNGGTTTPAPGETTVSATLSDYDIELSRSTVPAGSVTFEISNEAEQVHEFVVFATDLAPDALPTTDNGNEVDEHGEGLTVVDEVEDIEGGASATLTVDLDPGHYVPVCNLPAHYKLGMRTEFTVE